MRRLIPFSFAELGLAEWALLLLALGGLSFLARPRWVTALSAGALAALLALLRLVDFEGSRWDAFGPLLVAPPFLAAVLLAGYARPFLARFVGPRGLLLAWLAALLALSFARPFGLGPAAWPLLALFWLGLASLERREWPGLRLKPFRAWQIHAILLLGISSAVGVGWPRPLFFLAFLALAHAVLAQGPQMRKYVRRRLLGAPVVLVILLMASFALIRAAPGSPFDKEKAVAPEVRVLLARKYRLDEPLHVQFGAYMSDLVWKGDLGESTKHKGQTANDIIARHAGPSLRLGLAATAIALLLGLTSGLVAGIRRNSIFDYASMTGAMVGLALPTFVVGPLLVLLFSMKLRWFNVAGWDDPRDIVLPAIALALPFAARVARLTRAGMLEIVHQDYVRTARAKGLSEPMIVLRHTLKGALLPVVTFLGPAIAQLLTGSLVVETIFGVPGLGVEFIQSAVNRDYSLAMGLVVFFGGLLIAFNLAVDIAYGFLDPRIRHA